MSRAALIATAAAAALAGAGAYYAFSSDTTPPAPQPKYTDFKLRRLECGVRDMCQDEYPDGGRSPRYTTKRFIARDTPNRGLGYVPRREGQPMGSTCLDGSQRFEVLDPNSCAWLDNEGACTDPSLCVDDDGGVDAKGHPRPEPVQDGVNWCACAAPSVGPCKVNSPDGGPQRIDAPTGQNFHWSRQAVGPGCIPITCVAKAGEEMGNWDPRCPLR